MSSTAECQHDLAFRDRIFASKGKGRVCPQCGAYVFVDTPILNAVLGVSPLIMAVLLAFAWTDGGIFWLWFFAGITTHVFLYVFELKQRAVQEYDHNEHHKHTKRNYILLGVILVSVGLLLYLAI